MTTVHQVIQRDVLTPLLRDHVRQAHPAGDRYRAQRATIKVCLGCNHWAWLHPGHGPCKRQSWWSYRHSLCVCPAFEDPEPGRPDRIFTREQIDTMKGYRWRPKADSIYLLKDGRYGIWDQWSSPEWLAPPGANFNIPPEPT